MGFPQVKIPVENEPLRQMEYIMGAGAVFKDTYLYPVIITKRPRTVVIYNVATTDGGWTRIPATGTNLSNVLAWRLSEALGDAFDYAFVAAPTAYMTAYGVIQRDTEITAVYARRLTTSSTNINLQLEVWT